MDVKNHVKLKKYIDLVERLLNKVINNIDNYETLYANSEALTKVTIKIEDPSLESNYLVLTITRLGVYYTNLEMSYYSSGLSKDTSPQIGNSTICDVSPRIKLICGKILYKVRTKAMAGPESERRVVKDTLTFMEEFTK